MIHLNVTLESLLKKIFCPFLDLNLFIFIFYGKFIEKIPSKNRLNYHIIEK